MSALPADRCRIPQAFWAAVARLDLPPAALLRQARLPGTLHLGGPAFVTTAQFFALWKALEALRPEPGLGLRLVVEAETAGHPPSSLAAFHARDYRDGLARMARFKRLCTPEELHVAEAGGECVVTSQWLHAAEPEPDVVTDVTFATLVELGRRGTGQPLVPKRVELRRPKPGHDGAEAYFGGPIRYRAARNALVLASADLDRPFPGHNPDLLEMLTPALAAALGELKAQSSVAEKVKIVLKRRLASGRPDLTEVASELGMSERTLQRRITEEGGSFRELLAAARRELGRQLLADPAAEIDEVACLLGYQDTSSFYRAFRDWEGLTPNRWRELHLAAPAPRAGAEGLMH
ncbi:AraC family transcriptional regulator [Aureimonas endophytica]|uniref:AraC family transcriptional regulator n=1 Tax=Aureimonas endophytica TaxID=2027858 RepID=A0A916ZUN8_9HYPH|nr:AraC family transcriptional regulator [Aureimonas endophytica]GGE15067.1 AraC family transcriptional regulator [Aureimonas endophytica]